MKDHVFHMSYFALQTPPVEHIVKSFTGLQIVVSINFYGSGQNVVMGVYDWGWEGSTPTGHDVINFTNVSQKTLDMLHSDYPQYSLTQ